MDNRRFHSWDESGCCGPHRGRARLGLNCLHSSHRRSKCMTPVVLKLDFSASVLWPHENNAWRTPGPMPALLRRRQGCRQCIFVSPYSDERWQQSTPTAEQLQRPTQALPAQWEHSTPTCLSLQSPETQLKNESQETTYCKQLYVNKVDNLEERDKFLESYNLPRLNQEEIENRNRSSTSTEIETVILKLPTNKSPGPEDLTGKFYQTFGEELTTKLFKLFHKFAEEGTLPNSFYEATITLIPKSGKKTKQNTQKRKLQPNITDEHRCKKSSTQYSKPNSIFH